MSRFTNILLAATALVAVAGCAKKRPPVLPPAPADSSSMDQSNSGNSNGSANGAIVPGSNADFQRSVQSNTVNFALDMYDIDSTARAILDSQAQWLARYPNVRITIEGHADERGTREYNLALGDRRANATKNYLAAKGVPSERMTTISYGKERPLRVGSDDQSWAENRRAVTVVLN